jgi:urease accessory protein
MAFSRRQASSMNVSALQAIHPADNLRIKLMRQISTLAFAALLLVPTAAFAHTGISAAHDLTHGVLHPLTGLDHILAMITVGIFAAQLGGRALWLVPVTFVLVMAAAGAAAMSGLTVPFVEVAIALSVVVLGAVVAFNAKAPVAAAMGLVGFFAIFHGYAHGAELPQGAGGLGYGLGFVAATALLHLAGVGIGLTIAQLGGRHTLAVRRTAGALVAIAGLGLLTGMI